MRTQADQGPVRGGPGFAVRPTAPELCDLGQVVQLPGVSVSLSVQWDREDLPHVTRGAGGAQCRCLSGRSFPCLIRTPDAPSRCQGLTRTLRTNPGSSGDCCAGPRPGGVTVPSGQSRLFTPSWTRRGRWGPAHPERTDTTCQPPPCRRLARKAVHECLGHGPWPGQAPHQRRRRNPRPHSPRCASNFLS